jgi:hypothetical protein
MKKILETLVAAESSFVTVPFGKTFTVKATGLTAGITAQIHVAHLASSRQVYTVDEPKQMTHTNNTVAVMGPIEFKVVIVGTPTEMVEVGIYTD